MYYIVAFKPNDDVAVIPGTWLDEDKQECRFPCTKNPDKVKKLVCLSAEPGLDWPVYEIRILHTYSSYDAAYRNLAKAEETSNLSSDAGVVTGKRKQKKKRYYTGIETSDDTDAEEVGATDSNVIKPSQSLIFPPRPNQYQQQPPGPLTDVLTTQDLISTETPIHNTQTPTPSSTQTQILNYLKIIARRQKQQDHEIASLKATLLDIKSTLCGQMASSNDANSSTDPCPVQLPVSDLGSVRQLDEWLKNEQQMKQMVNFMYQRCSHAEVKKTVHAIIRNIMTPQLIVKFNWLGRGEKAPFSIYSNIHLMIYNVAKKISNSQIVLSQTNGIAKNFLRFAPDRENRRLSNL